MLPVMTAWERLYPRSSARARLFAAALVWTAVGTGLTTAGAWWISGRGAVSALMIAAPAAAVGWAKGRFVLAPRAARNAERIRALGDGRCLGGTFTWGTWILVAGFVILGAGLRRSPLPRPILGFIYVAVGLALLIGAARGWSAWMAAAPVPDRTAGPGNQ